ncbi:MAG TPA: CsbD family protein [Dermatophilaceae bacterium]
MGWKDKLKNKRDETGGAAKEQLGKATDDGEMEREGKIDQTKSNLKQAGEKVKDALNKD